MTFLQYDYGQQNNKLQAQVVHSLYPILAIKTDNLQMNSANDNKKRDYMAPPSMAPQIHSLQKQYYLFVLLGALLCGAVTLIHLAFYGDPKAGGANPLPALFILLSIVIIFFRSRVTRSDTQLKSLLASHVGNLPADYATILSVARTIDDPKIIEARKRFQRYQLLGASVAGYFVALAIPLFIFAVMKR